MKVQLLPSSFDNTGAISQHQRLTCFVIDDSVAIDAGSLAFSCSSKQREQIRDVVISHTHLDHLAGLPIFIDDLFAGLTEPVRVHVTRKMADSLEKYVFNWDIYPRFSELANDHGRVMEYKYFEPGETFQVSGVAITDVLVNHNNPSAGFIVSDGLGSIGITGDTAETEDIWLAFARCENLRAIFVECAFPNEMDALALASHHLTPKRLLHELRKVENRDSPVFVSNIKAMYRDRVVELLLALEMPNLEIVEVGKVYQF